MTIVCPNCKYEGKPKKKRPGSLLLEIFLWVGLFVIPGVIYTIWRWANRRAYCPQCGYQYVMKVKEKKTNSKK